MTTSREPYDSANLKTFISLAVLKEYPKAGPRKLSNRSREKLKRIVVTDTPDNCFVWCTEESAETCSNPPKICQIESEDSDEPV